MQKVSIPTPSRALSLLREHAPIVLAFLATRLVLLAAGLRFNLDLRWMFLDDLEALRQRLFETVYYFHAFAPGMNLITGCLLKISPDHLLMLAAGLFWVSGGLLTASLAQVIQTLGYSRWAAMALALVFSLLPQTLFLENLYLYTHPCAALLCFAALLFHRALRAASARAWFWFFLTIATLGWLYTVFHLLWFMLMVLLALVLQLHTAVDTRRGGWRACALGAAFPALLMVGLYAKNYALFGVFGATSWGPSNMTLATTQQMPRADRERWIREGKLSPYAAVNVYAPPSTYLSLLPHGVQYPWPGSNALFRPSNGEANYNHGLFLEVNEARRKDVAYYLEARPTEYLIRAVTKNLPGLFYPTTHWHPADRRPDSPHHQHRAVLGRYERLYDRVVHGWPIRGVGLYVFLPAFLGWATWSAWARLRSRDRATRAAGALLGFNVLQIAFVVSASSLFTAWETSRYRYTIEPSIWVIVAVALLDLYPRLRGWVSGLRRRSPTDPLQPARDATAQ